MKEKQVKIYQAKDVQDCRWQKDINRRLAINGTNRE